MIYLYPGDLNKIIHVRVTNIGTDAAKEVKIQVQPQFPFTTDGSIKYIDRFEPGQSTVVQFAVNVDKAATIGNYGVGLILDFQDPQGKVLQDIATTPLTVQNKGLLQARCFLLVAIADCHSNCYYPFNKNQKKKEPERGIGGSMANNIIEIKDLVKKFGNFTAVNKMNLTVKEGEILGFLGPNGAGKTTTISMLTTLINPTAGDAKIAGYDLLKEVRK